MSERQPSSRPKKKVTDEPTQEEAAKKKLHGFLSDLLKFGCLKGFKYFTMYMRGREELLVRVQNEQICSGHNLPKCHGNSFDDEEDSSSDSFPNKKGLPRNSESFVMSRDTQRSLSGFKFLAIGLPPASPCSTEISPIDFETTLFLVATYARYKSPYVWVRGNHERLIKLSECDTDEQELIKDSPLSLRTVKDWSTKDIKVWDIIAEIVRVNVTPPPRNPFAVDHAYFDTLLPEECIIATGAMAFFLQKLLLKDHSYNAKLSDDLHEVTKRHFQALQSLVCKTSVLNSEDETRRDLTGTNIKFRNQTNVYNR